MKRKFRARVIARRVHEISRGSCDRASPLWKPCYAISIFRVAAQFGLMTTRAIEFFFAIAKFIFDRAESSGELR
jgi:hypothetical protein